jgi:hypothetical protein
LSEQPAVRQPVRPNYPATGKFRIYLNKVASASEQTALAWFVLG